MGLGGLVRARGLCGRRHHIANQLSNTNPQGGGGCLAHVTVIPGGLLGGLVGFNPGQAPGHFVFPSAPGGGLWYNPPQNPEGDNARPPPATCPWDTAFLFFNKRPSAKLGGGEPGWGEIASH